MDNYEIIFLLVGVIVGIFALWAILYARRKMSEIPPELPTPEASREEKIEAKPEEPLIPPRAPPEVEAARRPPEPVAVTPEEVATSVPSALAATKRSLTDRIRGLFSSRDILSADELESLEEILYTADIGPQTVQRLIETVRSKVNGRGVDFEVVRTALKNEIYQICESGRSPQLETELIDRLNWPLNRPAVFLIVGVNGAGKTTTIGKLAAVFSLAGKRVVVAAGDTFRAAAGEQLKVWTQRAEVEIFNPEGVIDPSAVAYQAIEKAQSSDADVVIIDTAGRLHTQKNLMEELKKVKRVIDKKLPGAPHEILLVLDANNGQNALLQAKEFNQALQVTGVILTKLDGSAKGGVAIGIAAELQIPIKLIGVGEKLKDLRTFEPKEFVESIL